MYRYNVEAGKYFISGRSALLNAKTTLLTCVTDKVEVTSDHVDFNHTLLPFLSEFQPFHDELDLNSLVSTGPEIETEPKELYEAEQIVKKRFNAQKTQYEYYVKWVGYASSENTWELPSNIPSSMLNEFESSLLGHSSTSEEPRRLGLRDRASRKLTCKPDYIVNT